jgi:DNA-binding transcriptional ArsR family regulator
MRRSVDRVFFALSDPVRRAILRRLDEGPALVSELAAPFEMSLQAVSRHIQVLVRSGLVAQERTGRIARCNLDAAPLYDAAVWINRTPNTGGNRSTNCCLRQSAAASKAKAGGEAGKTRQSARPASGRQQDRKENPVTLRNTPHILELSTRLQAVRKELRQALAETARADVGEYVFQTLDGPVTLKSLFGDKRDLFVVHNMGKGCNSCSMWADGLNGFYPHIADRAVLVVASPDTPVVQAEFAASRGWLRW